MTYGTKPGYSEESKAYNLYYPINHKVIISRDVIFDEQSEWKTSPTQEIEASTSQSFIEHVDEEEQELPTTPQAEPQQLRRSTRESRPLARLTYAQNDKAIQVETMPLLHP